MWDLTMISARAALHDTGYFDRQLPLALATFNVNRRDFYLVSRRRHGRFSRVIGDTRRVARLMVGRLFNQRWDFYSPVRYA